MEDNIKLAIGKLEVMVENMGWEDFDYCEKYKSEILEIINLLKK